MMKIDEVMSQWFDVLSGCSSSSSSQWRDGRRHYCLYVHISN